MLLWQGDDDEPFNPEYVEVDRVLDKSITTDAGERVVHYLVLWKSLPYEDSTWELEQDVDDQKIQLYHLHQQLPSREERQVSRLFC